MLTSPLKVFVYLSCNRLKSCMGILNGLNDNINIAEKGKCILCIIILRTTFSFLKEILKRNILMHFIAIAKVILPLSYSLNDIIHVSGVMNFKATILRKLSSWRFFVLLTGGHKTSDVKMKTYSYDTNLTCWWTG